jgi:hypothetical protein
MIRILFTMLIFISIARAQGVLEPRLLKRAGATNGQALVWSDANNIWQPATVAGSGTVTNAAALTLDMPVFGEGGNAIKVGTKTGTGNEAVMSQSPTLVGPLIGNLSEAPCDSSLRGKVTVVTGGAGVGDTARMCLKTDTDSYVWRPIL